MPRRSVLTATEREQLPAFPDDEQQRIQHDTLSDSDLAMIRERRGQGNRLGFALQLCYLRFHGRAPFIGEMPNSELLEMLSQQLGIPVQRWDDYGQRVQTRVEHLAELKTLPGLRTFALANYRRWVVTLAELAQRSDQAWSSLKLSSRDCGRTT